MRKNEAFKITFSYPFGLRRYVPLERLISSDDYAAMSDEELQSKNSRFKGRLLCGAGLREILPEAYATIRSG